MSLDAEAKLIQLVREACSTGRLTGSDPIPGIIAALRQTQNAAIAVQKARTKAVLEPESQSRKTAILSSGAVIATLGLGIRPPWIATGPIENAGLIAVVFVWVFYQLTFCVREGWVYLRLWKGQSALLEDLADAKLTRRTTVTTNLTGHVEQKFIDGAFDEVAILPRLESQGAARQLLDLGVPAIAGIVALVCIAGWIFSPGSDDPCKGSQCLSDRFLQLSPVSIDPQDEERIFRGPTKLARPWQKVD